MSECFVGIEIGGTKFQLVTGTTPFQIDQRFRVPVDRSLGAPGILAAIETSFTKLLRDRTPVAIGIGFGGPVNPDSQQVACSHHIKGWDGFHFGDWIHDLCDVPLAIDNDANVAALAEATYGSGKGANPVFYVTLGSGVGGGLITDGKIYHGAIPSESEIGHLRLNREGLIVENSCSGWAVDNKIREVMAQDANCRLAILARSVDGPPAMALSQALVEEDPNALAILQSTAEDLALGLSHVVHLQHPKTIIIGGGLSLLGQPLMDAVTAALPRFVMKIMHPPPAIHVAALGEDVVPIGALALAEQAFRASKAR